MLFQIEVPHSPRHNEGEGSWLSGAVVLQAEIPGRTGNAPSETLAIIPWLVKSRQCRVGWTNKAVSYGCKCSHNSAIHEALYYAIPGHSCLKAFWWSDFSGYEGSLSSSLCQGHFKRCKKLLPDHKRSASLR